MALPDAAMTRTTIASFREYAEAQAAVDALADQRFPVERLAIVGQGLRTVEQVTGRKGLGRAAVDGAASGALTGAFLGFVFGLFSLVEPLVSGLALALWGVLIGAVLGAVLGLLSHAATGGQRDFSSVRGVSVERYDLLADPEVADEARRLLAAP